MSYRTRRGSTDATASGCRSATFATCSASGYPGSTQNMSLLFRQALVSPPSFSAAAAAAVSASPSSSSSSFSSPHDVSLSSTPSLAPLLSSSSLSSSDAARPLSATTTRTECVRRFTVIDAVTTRSPAAINMRRRLNRTFRPSIAGTSWPCAAKMAWIASSSTSRRSGDDTTMRRATHGSMAMRESRSCSRRRARYVSSGRCRCPGWSHGGGAAKCGIRYGTIGSVLDSHTYSTRSHCSRSRCRMPIPKPDADARRSRCPPPVPLLLLLFWNRRKPVTRWSHA
ncbi:hypothetical protein DQ04_13831010 [Trypanosoma grayi]|uniref:hypothetical protein n=1 Tax=Trypanosoma grayi TaxID=71804 RepID=UPI0004F479EE|nr:hypothetical protein DQ04_13831010 [Trypanosoma grayi]KEG06458.1 hypothetical protein DQ04_13831010 [Trypanosoma grayi]